LGALLVRLSEQGNTRLLEAIGSHEKICSYMDVPLQHASTNVLKLMRRGAGADIFLKSIEKMRRIVPDITLRTTFIVGFPGETQRDFEELCDFVEAAEFDWLGAFGYSDQEGAKAYALETKVPAREIERRRKKLMELRSRSAGRRSARWWVRSLIYCSRTFEETDLLGKVGL